MCCRVGLQHHLVLITPESLWFILHHLILITPEGKLNMAEAKNSGLVAELS